MKRPQLIVGVSLLSLVAGSADAAYRVKKGTADVDVYLGPLIGITPSSGVLFKIGSDWNYALSDFGAFCGTFAMGFRSGIFNLEIAPGAKFRIKSLYKSNVNLGIKAQPFFDIAIPSGGSAYFAFGVKFGPAFYYMFSDGFGAGMFFNVKLGAVSGQGTTTFNFLTGQTETTGSVAFFAAIDLMFGVNAVF